MVLIARAVVAAKLCSPQICFLRAADCNTGGIFEYRGLNKFERGAPCEQNGID